MTSLAGKVVGGGGGKEFAGKGEGRKGNCIWDLITHPEKTHKSMSDKESWKKPGNRVSEAA